MLNFWPIYPRFFKELFTRAFTAGLLDPHSRVTENEWRAAMVRLRDGILYCPACAAANFYDQVALREAGGSPPACWACKKPVTLPFRIRLGRGVVMLNHDTQLFPHHVEPGQEYVFDHPVAEVTRHPKKPGQWGLKNLGHTKWTLAGDNGQVVDVEPGRSAALVNGTRVNFGAVQGEVRY